MKKALNVPVEEFLRPMFGPGEKICLRVFDDKKTGAFKRAKLETTLSGLPGLMDTLKKHNEQNRGIYFVVNFGGHEDAEISRVNAQFMECDDLPLEEQLKQIEAFPLTPSLIVKTRKSLHTYWLIKDGDVASFRRVQKRLAAHFHGDRSCVNESRVLRLPGFNHCKKEPVAVECIHFRPELRYTQTELEQYLPQIPEEHAAPAGPAAKGTRQGLSLVLRRCAFMQHCRDNAASLSEHDWYAMITNLAVFEDGDRAIHQLSALYPGYKAAETAEKIQHYLASGTKPITCKAIAEKGFACPKLADGSCSCKAPAALCYQPMTLDELREALAAAKVYTSPVEDMRAAKRFVKESLYNIEPLDAGPFIEYEIKEHFRLKPGDTKALAAYHKELHKAYAAKKDARQAAQDNGLPEWYEMTERGGLRFRPGVLADYLAKEAAAFYSTGTFYAYENGVYRIRNDLWAANKVREHMMVGSATQNAITDCAWQWRIQIVKPLEEINANPFVINLRNGLYNVLDRTLAPHTPAFYSTVQIQAAYSPEAKCPAFLQYLHGVLDEPEICLMQEILGYFLVPLNKAQKSFVLVGAPNAGKSTILSVVQDILLGRENVSNIPWQGLGDRFNKAELFGKLANIFADLPTKAIEDNGFFKAATGEDYISAERKNKDPFSFRPYARFLFSCNEIPRNYGDRSDGFYRRLIIIRFSHSVPKAKRDPNLLEKLAAERDGILMWALTGLHRLMEQNYQFTETEDTQEELRRYKVESNSALLFVEECCVISPDAVSAREEVFDRYREYCVRNGLRAMSQTSFNRDVEGIASTIRRATDNVASRRIWRGLGLQK